MTNKIHKYNFLIVGGGLIGALAGLHLRKKGYKVLVIEKNIQRSHDQRTLAVNANSKDFLMNLGLWKKLKNAPQKINKIVIKDFMNKDPLIFENKNEEMGNVILNSELLDITRKQLKNTHSMIEIKKFEFNQLFESKELKINNNYYSFDHVILSFGKNFSDNNLIKKFCIPSSHHAFVGFFDHSLSHDQTAYEIFTSKGPLAVLPSPSKKTNSSTFIYSTKDKLSHSDISSLIKKNFAETHGKIHLNNLAGHFSIQPHLSQDRRNKFFLIGDTLRSIHPVAGQGWNLGIKDIQILSSLLDNYNLSEKDLAKKYAQTRIIESAGYLSFTTLINYMYENENPISNLIVKGVFNGLKNISFLRNIFIQQAMGRLKLI